MQAQLYLSDPLSGRSPKAGLTNVKAPQGETQTETANAVRSKSKAIEVGQLPMVRKGGRTAVVFDRMDSNGNGVLTRAELISYRLAPMVSYTAVDVSPMPAETMKQIGEAAKAKIESDTSNTGTSSEADAPEIGFGEAPSLEAAFGIADAAAPAGFETASAPTAPSSLPESVVMAQAATNVPEAAFA